MIDILIFGKDFVKCKETINEITQLNFNLKISKIANSEKELIKILKYNEIDIIILIICNLEELKILKQLEKYDKIIISYKQDVTEYLNKFRYKNVLENIKGNKKLQDLLSDLMMNNNKNEKIIKEKINKELRYLHFNFSHKGTSFLRDCIYYIYVKNSRKFNLSNEIYVIISKKYNLSVNTIKCDIFQACSNAYYECEEKKLIDYLNVPCIEKPTTRDFIKSILEKI